MEIYTGLNANQFRLLKNVALPLLLTRFKHFEKSQIALYIYLMKLRTGHTYEQIAPLFNLSPCTVGLWIRTVRI